MGIKDYYGLKAVVTGGATGIGREFLVQLVRQGCHVAFCDVNESLMEATKTQLEKAGLNHAVKVICAKCDVTRHSEVEAFLQLVLREFDNEVDILVNNAGITGIGKFLDFSSERFDAIFNVTFQGTVNMTRAFMPAISRSKTGFICNISSTSGLTAASSPILYSPYSAAKGALHMFSQSLYREAMMFHKDLTISCAFLGQMATDVFNPKTRLNAQLSEAEIANKRQIVAYFKRGVEKLSSSDVELEFEKIFRMGSNTKVEKAVGAVLDGMRRRQFRIVVGEDAAVADVLSRFFPNAIFSPIFQVLIFMPWKTTSVWLGRTLNLPTGYGTYLAPALFLTSMFVPLVFKR